MHLVTTYTDNIEEVDAFDCPELAQECFDAEVIEATRLGHSQPLITEE